MRYIPLLLVCTCVAADTVSVPPNLKAEGVPPIPEALAKDLSRYNEFRMAALQDWHPARREVMISTRFGQVSHMHRVTMPGGARTQLTFGPERTTSATYDPVSGQRFLYSRDTGGSEFYQIFLFDIATGRSTMLTDGESRNGPGMWSPDGKLIAHSSTRRNGRETDVWVMDPSDPKSARIVLESTDGAFMAPGDWSADSKRLAIGKYTSVDTAMLFEVDLATGNKRALTPDVRGVSFEDPQYTPDGKSLYVLTNENSDFTRLAILDLNNNRTRVLTPDLKWDVVDAELSTDGKRLAYVVNEDGASVLHVLDTGSRRELVMPRLPLGVISGLTWRKGTHELAFSLASARSPADVYSIDADSGKLDRWTHSETGGLNAQSFVEPEIIRWKSFDGLMVSGFYYKPPAQFAGPRPVLVQIHGGPEGQYQPGYLGRNNYFLNELGVALIFPNVRGSTGYGKKFVNLDNVLKREDSVKDIGALLDWIATRPDLDARRVMVMGGSYGGYMTLASMTHYNDRLCCGVDIVGIANFVTFLERTEAYRRDMRRQEYGDERDPKVRDFMLSIAPVKHVQQITKPMLIVQGRNDPRVPWTESEQMVEAIRKNGMPVSYLLASDEGHGFAKKNNADFQFATTVLFVKEYLLQ